MGGRGRGGRFGGRGGSRTGAPSTMDLTRDAAEDLGIAGLNFMEGPPPLYPEISLPPPSNLTADEKYIIARQHDLLYRLHRSPYHLVHEAAVADVERWGDGKRGKSSASTLESHLTESTPGSHLPEELVGKLKLGGGQARETVKRIKDLLSTGGAEARALTSLEERELKLAGRGDAPEGEEKKGEGEGEATDEDADFDNEVDDDADNDYGQDYYASDNESGGDDA